MAFTEVRSGPTALSTTVTLIHAGATSPTRTIVLFISLCNTNTSTVRSVSVYLESTTTGAAADALLSAVPITPNTTLIVRGPFMLASTEDITAKQDVGTDVTMIVSGYEQ